MSRAALLAAVLAIPLAASAADKPENAGPDRKVFEAHLKERLAKLEDHHQTRVDFGSKEDQEYQSFWTKVREERRLFEIRITRQTMDMFESLASLDHKAHPDALADFERMQNNVLKAFEAQQRKKIAGFFEERERRWKEFRAAQDKERAEFFAQTGAGWKRIRASLALGPGPAPAAKN